MEKTAGEVLDVEVPAGVSRLAVPAEWLEYFFSPESGVVVIKKQPPQSRKYAPGARHWFAVRIPILVRGGIRMPRQKEPGKEAVRQLKFATVAVLPDANALLTQYSSVKASGWLVFERQPGGDWKVCGENPDAWVYCTAYWLNSRSARAKYTIVSTSALWARTVQAVTAVTTAAALVAVAPFDSFTIEYLREEGDYRGPVLQKRFNLKITLTEGGVVETPLEVLSEGDVI